MLSARVKQVVEASDPRDQVAFLLELDTREETRNADGITDLSKRIITLRTVYSRAKQPLLDVLNRYSSDGIRIVDELSGTPQFIAEGPAGTWKRVLRDCSVMFNDPGITVFANDARMSVPDCVDV